MKLRVVLSTMLLLLLVAAVFAKGEYNSKYLYTKTNDADTGGLVLTVAKGAPTFTCAVAVGRKGHDPFLGTLTAGGTVARWEHLPVDVYDVLLIGDTDYYEGLRLVREPDAALKGAEGTLVEREINNPAWEGFFDRKLIERLEMQEEDAYVLLQEWRAGTALTQGADVIKGTIHSLMLVYLTRPAKGWQIPQHDGVRQLYREEIALKGALAHHYVAGLGGLRVTTTVLTVPPVVLQ